MGLKVMKEELKDANINIHKVGKIAENIALQDETKKEMKKMRETVLGIKDDFQDIRTSMDNIKQHEEKNDGTTSADELHSMRKSMGKMLKDFHNLKDRYFSDG